MHKQKKNSQPNCEFFFISLERVFRLPLQTQDQVSLLKDILNNHQTDCCGSVAECEQLERLVKSLMVNTQIDQNVKSILQEVYDYSQSGTYTADLDQHILSNQDNLSQWVDDIDSFS
ncbi:MAG: hypothetical protein K0Q87_307 [Neobacillus sp.]|jgi:hypothetical protein|nr:hypothetical protein [Neobacillus sp.]